MSDTSDGMAVRDRLFDELRAALTRSPLSVNSQLAVLSMVMLTIAFEARGPRGLGLALAQVKESIDRAVANVHAVARTNGVEDLSPTSTHVCLPH
jgi:hypothetical protein